MDYKKKLKSRLNIAITYIVLGVMFIVGTFITKTENDFISTFGFMMILMGLVRIRNYRIITKDEDTIRKQQIIETDERNILQRSRRHFRSSGTDCCTGQHEQGRVFAV